jgi:hypothetical protein
VDKRCVEPVPEGLSREDLGKINTERLKDGMESPVTSATLVVVLHCAKFPMPTARSLASAGTLDSGRNAVRL